MFLLDTAVITSLNFMWQGMLGIFIVIVVIALIVKLMAKADEASGKKKNTEEQE